MAAQTKTNKSMRSLSRLSYALYAGLLFVAVGLTALAGLLVTPGLARRRRLARACSGALLRLLGMPLSVSGLELLPGGQCILVSNHVSYLDGIVFTAALPPRFGFVIKREMASVPLAATVLRRIGSEFVERFKPGRSVADARRVLRTAASGRSLVFFPEGTFSEGPGLLKFHAGAFITAVRAGCPVVPAVIRGTRTALGPTDFLPRPCALSVELLPAVTAEPGAADAAESLRERARMAIQRALREPDRAAA
ncbi:MAG TPA: lysophospholipid acyltransferase family protein [Steroidobacteraceae bacterium]|nr:lysophospholipid acyltransferase family protein [Steroidobacteraceae bacterium]